MKNGVYTGSMFTSDPQAGYVIVDRAQDLICITGAIRFFEMGHVSKYLANAEIFKTKEEAETAKKLLVESYGYTDLVPEIVSIRQNTVYVVELGLEE